MATNGPNVPGIEDLVALNRSATIARLVVGVFHDLNNCLQVIGGVAELLQETPGLPDPVVDGLRRIHAQNAKAGSAIAEVMAFTRPTSAVCGRVNMRELTARAVGLRTFAVGRARLAIGFNAPATGVVEVNGHANLLMQAVLNLIVNAEQSLAGQPGGTIRLQMELPEGWVVLRVTDNGRGVPPTIVDRLYDPFITTKSRDESSGLGLTVARQIAERHGGTLTHELPASGASFVLTLPAM